jgi:antitoxin (DNA-binding transcriptional repressor) of toxin-antitoxin stability system
MNSVTIEEAQAKLPEIVAHLAPGETLVVTRQQRPVATLVGEQTITRKSRQPGTCKDMILWMSDDFDAPLDDFREYMA